MDPITALATISTIWAGIKQAVKVGKEVEGVFNQLSKWAQAADILEQAVEKPKKPPIFKKLDFSNDTKEAFDAYAAKVKIREMEAEIRHEFLYGGLCHLGMDGLREFYNLRRSIREQRIKAIQDQAIRRQEIIEYCFTGGLILLGSSTAVLILWVFVKVVLLGAR